MDFRKICMFSMLLILVMHNALAAGYIKMSDVIEYLQGQGYVMGREVSLDNDIYEAKVFDTKGQLAEVDVDVKTGQLIHSKPLLGPKVSMLDAVREIEAKGYRVVNAEEKSDHYKVKAEDQNGKEAVFNVDYETGKVSYHIMD